jgi:hypothetical protein
MAQLQPAGGMPGDAAAGKVLQEPVDARRQLHARAAVHVHPALEHLD